MVEYLRQMSELVADSSDPEQATQALSAIVTEIKGKEALIATDQKLSKVLEKLIESDGASSAVITALFSQLNSCAVDLVYDQYGSHVFESLLKSAGRVELGSELSKITSEFSEFLAANMCDIVADRRATFVLRTALVVFGGFETPSEGDYLENIKKLCSEGKVSSSFSVLIDGLCNLSDSEIEELAESPHSSVTLQTALILASKTDYVESGNRLADRMFLKAGDKSIDCERLARFLNEDSSSKSKLVEVAIGAASSSIPSQLLEEYIAASRDDFYDCKFSFAFLQAVIPTVIDEKGGTVLFTEILSAEGIVECVKRGKNHGIGVLQKTADLLVSRFHAFQQTFINKVLAAARAETQHVWMTFLSLHPSMFEAAAPSDNMAMIEESKITPQGCLFLSTVFRFKVTAIQPLLSYAKPLIEHIRSVQLEKSKFFTDIGPGRMLQTLISPPCAFPTSIKMKIVRNLMLNETAPERLEKLVADRKVGSWIVTTAWDSADVQTKALLGEKLVAIDGLRDSNWKVWKHCSLASFSRRNDEWTMVETRKLKAKNLLKDIVGDYAPDVKKKIRR